MVETKPLSNTAHGTPFPSPNLAEDILETIQTIILVGNGEGQIVYASPSIERILGYSPAELLGDGFWELPFTANPKARHLHREEIARAARGEVPPISHPYSTKLLTKAGEERWILWHDAKGPGDLIIGAGQDITEQRRAEEEINRRERDFRAIFESASDGILILNSDWVYVDVNPAACAICGYSYEQLVGKKHGSVVESETDLPRLRAEALANGTMTCESTIKRPDGETRHIEYSIITNFRAGHHLILTRDITVRRQLESQLTQAQKLEAVGRLAGGVAHDFNNMLTAIRGYSELLLKSFPEGKHRKYAEGILGAADRAAQTTQQLLAFSRRQVMQPKLLNVNEAVGEELDLLRRLIGEDIELVTALAPDAASIRVDRSQFGQILMNLAVNSRDAMQGGGKLIIETRNVLLDSDYVLKHIQVRAGAYVMLAVTDTGTGISADVKSHIFEPFFTTKPQGKGSGLGLATVYGIVKQSGGYVWVYSEPGEGTTFKIYLPQAQPETPQEPSKASGTAKILVIEDDEMIRTLATTVLRDRGYQVFDAVDGRQALALCQQYVGIFDLVITDVGAPGMSGEDLMGYFAIKYPNVAIVHMSGFPRAHLAGTHAVPREAYFLSKPFTVKQLLEAVEEVLSHRTHS